jgi:hypothetical protein
MAMPIFSGWPYAGNCPESEGLLSTLIDLASNLSLGRIGWISAELIVLETFGVISTALDHPSLRVKFADAQPGCSRRAS